jgi:hypothetical protein
MIALNHIENRTTNGTFADAVYGRPVSFTPGIDEIDFISYTDAGNVAEMVSLITVKMETTVLDLIV